VVRITIFVNGTYRLAIYMAKGGYLHMFYVGVDEPYEDVLSQTPTYVRSPEDSYINKVGEYIVEYPEVHYVTP